LEDIKLS